MQSRSASPMPNNIEYVKDSLPYGSRLILQDGRAIQPPFYRFVNDVRRYAPKILRGGLTAAGLYGAYKLGKYRNNIVNKFQKIKSGFMKPFNNPKANYTRSHT